MTTANQPEPSLPEKCNKHVYWWNGEYDGDCELPKDHLEPFHYDGVSYFDDDNNNRDYEQKNLEKLMQAHEEAAVREARLHERINISDAIKHQRENYKTDNLFNAEYQEGMSDAALIAYDADKHGFFKDGKIIYD